MHTKTNIFLKLQTRLGLFRANFFFFLMYLKAGAARNLTLGVEGAECRDMPLNVYQGGVLRNICLYGLPCCLYAHPEITHSYTVTDLESLALEPGSGPSTMGQWLL